MKSIYWIDFKLSVLVDIYIVFVLISKLTASCYDVNYFKISSIRQYYDDVIKKLMTSLTKKYLKLFLTSISVSVSSFMHVVYS